MFKKNKTKNWLFFHIKKVMLVAVVLLMITSCTSAELEINNSSPSPQESFETPQILPTNAAKANESGSEMAYPVYPQDKNQDSQITPAYPAPGINPFMEKDTVPSTASIYLSLDEPKRILWAEDGNSFALIGYQSLTYYAFPSLEIIYQFTPENGETLLDVAPDGSLFTVAIDMETIHIINWKNNQETVFKIDNGFLSAQFSPDSKTILFTLMQEMAVVLVNVHDGTIIEKMTGFQTAAPVYNVRVSKDGKHLLWYARATLQISDIEKNLMGQTFNHEDFITNFTTNSDTSIITTCAAGMENNQFDPYLFFWNPNNGDLIQKIKLNQPSYSFDFSPDDHWFVYNQLGTIIITNSETFENFSEFSAHSGSIMQLSFSPDGNYLASIGDDLNLKFWEIN